jgi:hypothetical protein
MHATSVEGFVDSEKIVLVRSILSILPGSIPMPNPMIETTDLLGGGNRERSIKP